MFEKLSKKYQVPNPLQKSPTAQAPGAFCNAAPPPSASSSDPSSGQTISSFSNQKPPLGASPFASSPTPATSPFGSASSTTAMSTFGNVAPASPSFGASSAPSVPSPATFGGASQPAPMAAPNDAMFNGRSAREILTAVYQRYNSAKLSQIDQFLTKYRGKEEQMFRMLAKKYNIDPSELGLPAAPTPAGGFGTASPSFGTTGGGFGQPSVLGGGSPFGGAGATTSGGFGQPSPLGGGGFGSSTAPTHTFGANSSPGFGGSSSSSFGAIAQNPPSTGFGSGFSPAAPAPTPFGASTPFGAPRR